MKRSIISQGVGVLAVLGAFVVPAGEVAAQATIDACYVQKTGLIYRIDPEEALPGGLPTECGKEDKHFQFAWNQQGVPGVSGYEIVMEKQGSTTCGSVVECYSSTGMAITCPAGKAVLSGGYRVDVTEGILLEGHKVVESYPSAADTWRFQLDRAKLNTNTSIDVWAYAVCVNAG